MRSYSVYQTLNIIFSVVCLLHWGKAHVAFILLSSFCVVACLSDNRFFVVLYRCSPCCLASPTFKNNYIATKLGHASSPSACLLACDGLLHRANTKRPNERASWVTLLIELRWGAGSGEWGGAGERACKQAGEGKVTLSHFKNFLCKIRILDLFFIFFASIDWLKPISMSC
jgi:hypothetical protein